MSNTSNGLATEYNTVGVGVTAAVIPPSAGSKLKSGLPTGQVWSGYGAGFFEVAAAKPANFIFATFHLGRHDIRQQWGSRYHHGG